MAGSDEDRTITGWERASRFYRRSPEPGWLLALLAVPLLLGLIGWSGIDRSDKDNALTLPSVDPSASLTQPSVAAPSASVPAASVNFAPFSLLRSGAGFTLTGDLPDADVKAGLLDSMRTAFPGVQLTDSLNVKADVNTPDYAGLGSVLGAAISVPDFGFKVDGDTITLTGTAPSEDVKADIEAAATASFPNTKIVNDIEVKAQAPSPPSAPPVTLAPTPAPAPPPGGQCANLQADITGLLRTPVNFATDGFTLTAGSQQMLRQVADKLKACPGAKVAVVGHTDNTGNDGINVPLSGNRAKSVADYLVSQGVAGPDVTSRGAGAANPIASNATPDGRAKNRRVDITVS